MDQPTDRIPDVAAPAAEGPTYLSPAFLSLTEPEALDLHREINARRAQLEDPELLRRLRAL